MKFIHPAELLGKNTVTDPFTLMKKNHMNNNTSYFGCPFKTPPELRTVHIKHLFCEVAQSNLKQENHNTPFLILQLFNV